MFIVTYPGAFVNRLPQKKQKSVGSTPRVRAEMRENIGIAFWSSCRAGVPTELHDPVTEIAADSGFEKLVHDLLDPTRIFQRFRIHPEPSADPDAMGVGNHPALSVNVTEQKVRDFTSDARKGQKFVHI